MFALVNAAQIKRERQNEKEDRGVDRGFAQHIAGFGTERRFCGTAAKGRSHAAVFGLLGQDDQHDKQRNEDEDEGENSEDDTHVKG